MEPRTLLKFTLAAGLLAAVGAAGCSLAKDEDTGSSPDEVVAGADSSVLLKSTLILQGGCTAAKVGPKQLLVSARCVTNNPAFAVGKVIAFASVANPTEAKGIVAANEANEDYEDYEDYEESDPAADAGAAPSDAGTPSDAAQDAGAAADAGDAGKTNAGRDLTIAEVKIHPSYVAKCKDTLCGFNKLESGDAPDIAVIILEKDLATVPSIPIDLDPVGQSDTLLVVNSGCASLDAKATIAPKASKTIAVPAKSVNHVGSAYEKSPQLVTRLGASYVVTAGAGWRSTEPRLCKSDLSSPLFRAGSAAVAGVTANYTTYADAKLPVTTHHTRVDAMSRYKIGAWLAELGAETIHSCSETAGGCVKKGYDGGAPMGPATEGDGTTRPGDTDGGPSDASIGDATKSDADKSDADKAPTTEEPGEAPTGPHSDQLPAEDPSSDYTGEDDPDYSDAAAPKKKKKKDEGGCSAAPGGPAPTGEMFLAFGLVLGAAVIRRRRAR